MAWPSLDKLIYRQFDDLSQTVQEVLSPVLCSRKGENVPENSNNLFLFMAKFLHASVGALSEDKTVQPELLKAIDLCCQGYLLLRDRAALNIDVLTVPKIVLNIISKLPHGAGVEVFIQVGRHMLHILQPFNNMDDVPGTIAFNSFTSLWNAAIILENQGQAKPIQLCQLRFLSLLILSRRPSKVPAALEKADLALNAFERLMKQRESTVSGKKRQNVEADFLCALHLAFGLLESTLKSGGVERRALLFFVKNLFRFLFYNQLLKHVAVLQEFIDDESKVPSENIDSEVNHFLKRLWTLASVITDISNNQEKPSTDGIDLDSGLHAILQWTQEDIPSSTVSRDVYEASVEVLRMFVRLIKSFGLTEQINLSVTQFDSLLSVVEQCQAVLSVDPRDAKDKEDNAGFRKSLLESHRAWFIVCFWTLKSHIEKADSLAEAVEYQVTKCVAVMESCGQSEDIAERYFLGCVSLKMASLLYKNERDEQAVPLYSTACQQLIQWCQADPDKFAARAQEVSLLKIHDCLAECQHRCGQLQDAKVTITRALALNSDDDFSNCSVVGALVRSWVKVTRLAWKEGDADVMCRTLGEGLKGSNLSVNQILSLLKEELTGLRSLSPRIYQAEAAVLQNMVEVSPGAVEKASSLLTLAHTLWQANSDQLPGCPQHYVEQAARLVTGKGSQLLQGRICLWRFIIGHEDLCRNFVKSSKEDDSTEEDSPTDTEAVDKQPSGPSTFVSMPRTLADQQEELSLLVQAVEFWEKGVAELEMTRISDHDQKETIRLFLLCADILRCHREFLLELRVLCLAYQVLATTDCESERLTVSSALINVLAALGVEQFPCQTLLEEATSDTICDKDRMVLKMRLANFYLRAGEVEEAASALTYVVDTAVWEKTVVDQVNRGTLSRLMAEYLSLPSTVRGDTSINSGDYVLSHVMEAVKCHTSAIHRRLGERATDRMAEGEVFRDPSLWALLSEHLQSVLFLGRMYQHIGDQRRARCYFKEGLKVCESQGWVKWTAVFTLELCHLHWLADNTSEAVQVLTGSALALNTNNSSDLNICQVEANTLRKSDPMVRKLSFAGAGDCFGFESVRDAAAGQDYSNLATGEITPAGQITEALDKAADVGFLQAVTTKLEERLKSVLHHPTACTCLYCQDVECRRLIVHQGLLSVRLSQDISSSQKKDPEALSSLETLCKNSQRTSLCQRVSTVLKRASLLDKSSTSSTLGMCGHVEEALDLAEVCCLKAELHLQLDQLPEVMAEVEKGLDVLASLGAHTAGLYTLKSTFHTLAATAFILRLRASTKHKGHDGADELQKQDLMDRVTQKLKEMRIIGSDTKIPETNGAKIPSPPFSRDTDQKSLKQRANTDSSLAAAEVNLSFTPSTQSGAKLEILSTPASATDSTVTASTEAVADKSSVCTDVLTSEKKKGKQRTAKVSAPGSKKPARGKSKIPVTKISPDKSVEDMLADFTLSDDESEPKDHSSSKSPELKSVAKDRSSVASATRKPAAKGRVRKTVASDKENASLAQRTVPSRKGGRGHRTAKGKVTDEDSCKDAENEVLGELLVQDENNCDPVSLGDVPLSTEKGGRQVSKIGSRAGQTTQKSRNSRAEQKSDPKTDNKVESVDASVKKSTRGSKTSEGKRARTTLTHKSSLSSVTKAASNKTRPQSGMGKNNVLEDAAVAGDDEQEDGLHSPSDAKAKGLDVYDLPDSEDEFVNASTKKKKAAKSRKTTQRKEEKETVPTEVSVKTKPASKSKTARVTNNTQVNSAAKTETSVQISKSTRGSKRRAATRSASKPAAADLDSSVEVVRACSDDENGKMQISGCRSSRQRGGAQGRRPAGKDTKGKKAHVKDSEDDPVHLTDEGTEKIRWHLEQAVTLLEHFPLVGLYSQACKLLGMENLDGDAWRTAAVLSEAAAVTLRHQFLITLHKQIRNHQKESAADNGRNSALEKKRELEALIAARDSVLFPWGTGRFQQMVNTIPEGWTVCQLSLLQHPNCPDKLLLTRLARDKDPVTVQLHSFSGLVGQSVMSEFQDIMQVNRTASKISCKVKWWSTRLELDMRLEGLLETIERRWLGAWRCLLLGQTSDSTYEGLLAAAAKKLARNLSTLLNTAVSVKMAKTLLELSHSADTEHHLPIILSHFLHIDADAPQMGGLVTALTDARPTVTPTPNQPVVLILDKNLHALPWENLPVLASQQVTRVASLAALHLMLQFNAGDSSVLQRGVDQTSVFYVVDPDNNLKYTLDTFKDMFSRQQGWKGIVGERPNKAQYCDALTQHDLFVYCGHGNGSKYLSGDELQQQRCRAVSVLMGCSSVRLDVKPRLDPDGFVFNYLLARCPSVVGNLWDVTDRDIDRFLKQLLDLWLEGDHDKPPSLPALIPAARLACRMRHLIGAAPVVYGLPVTLTKS